MAEIAQRVARQQETIGPFLVVAVILGLVGLPLAAWLDLRDLSDRIVRSQANEIGKIIDDMRAFYASDVVGRVLAAHGGPITADPQLPRCRRRQSRSRRRCRSSSGTASRRATGQ